MFDFANIAFFIIAKLSIITEPHKFCEYFFMIICDNFVVWTKTNIFVTYYTRNILTNKLVNYYFTIS